MKDGGLLLVFGYMLLECLKYFDFRKSFVRLSFMNVKRFLVEILSVLTEFLERVLAGFCLCK